MKIARLATYAPLRGALLVTAFASIAGAQNQTWIRQFGTPDPDYVTSAAPDGSGGLYVSGGTEGSLGGPTAGGTDAWLARYDSAGSQTWIRQFGTTGEDWSEAAAPDGAGGVYVSWLTFGGSGGPNGGASETWLAHYDGGGIQAWVRRIGSPNSAYVPVAAPDGTGGVYVSGSISGSTGRTDAWLAHYDSAGNQTWSRQFGATDHDRSVAAAPDGAGGVYLVGFTHPSFGVADFWLTHHDGAGNQSWIRQFGAMGSFFVTAAAPDGAGGVYVSGATRGSLGGPNAGRLDIWVAHYDGLDATRYCSPAVPNSTGQPGVLTATGSNAVAANSLRLTGSQLPQRTFGFFLTSMTQVVTAGPAGSQGNVCIAGAIGRFVGQGQILNAGATGTVSLGLDLNAWPTLLTVVQPGETWNFQAWYRDVNPGPTSNFTDAVTVTFR